MTSSTYLPRSFDHLGTLSAKLRDLQGYGTLARELIQNADDAPASWMGFDIRPDALIVDNDGVFAACVDIRASKCTWSSDGLHDHTCDFHRFRRIGSGDKRLHEGTTGAFGIGFIAVYQLTDHPELISAGQHWLLHEQRSETQRIEICGGCHSCSNPDLPGTRLILPFVRDRASPLRQALKADTVPENVTARLLEELERSLPVAMLFLKNLSTIHITGSGRAQQTFERVSDKDTLIVSRGESADDRVWHLIRGNFQDEAARLRHQHPGLIEDKRSAEVVIALPTEELIEGLLCAYLPTEERSGLPFHVNADFFTSSDRKHVILNNDYQSQWNREALLTAARAIADATPRLTRVLGGERFWHLVSALEALARSVRRDSRDSVWTEFWSSFEVALRMESVILTSSHEWTTVGSGVVVLMQSEQASNASVLEGLGIKLVTEDLRPYQGILRSLGVPILDITTLCSTLIDKGLDKPVHLNSLPSCLTSVFGREALWTEIAILLGQQEGKPHAKRAAERHLRAIALAPTIDNFLYPSQDLFCADTSTSQLFHPLRLATPFLEQTEAAFRPLSYLCRRFEVVDAVEALEGVDFRLIQRLYTEGRLPLVRLMEWFENRREQIVNDEDLRQRLAKLPIYPSAGQLHALTNLVLPGDFEDPLGLTSLVNIEALGGRRAFLVDLDIAELSFRTYILDHLSRALENEALGPKLRHDAVALLADQLGTLIDDDKIHQVLTSVRLIRCTDRQYRRAKNCYFPDNIVHEVLERNANVIVLPKGRKAAVRKLYEWLGVASTPRLHDIVQSVQRTVDGPFSDTAAVRIRKIVAYLGLRFEASEERSELTPLQSIEWLPARGDKTQWYQPDSLYAPYRSYLVDSQAAILDIHKPNRELLNFLGIHINPSPDLVVRHLLDRAEKEVPVNTEVYRFLNDNIDDPVVEQLRSAKCLSFEGGYRSPDHVFWGEPFLGRYRWHLPEGLRAFEPLLRRIGVKDTPDHDDVLGVLHDISAEFSDTNSPLDDDAYTVLMHCWKILEETLNKEDIAIGTLMALRNNKVIPNRDRILYSPIWFFFENRPGLADKFGDFLIHNVISRALGTEQAFLAAGVRPLSSAVELRLLRNEEPGENLNTRKLLSQRREEIARVLSVRMASQDVRSALCRLSTLKCMSATSLEVKYRLVFSDNVKQSQAELVRAVYQPRSHSLWATYPNGRPPWAPLARELASALCPEEDPGIFAAGLKEVLAAETTDEAATVLDDLGFARLDTSVVESPPSQEAAVHLGIAAPIDDEELPPHRAGDAAQPGMAPTGNTTKVDGLRGARYPVGSSTPVPRAAGVSSRVGSNAQPGGSASQPAATSAADPAPSVGGRDVREGVGRASRRTERGTRPRGGRKFVSYVALSPEGEAESDPDGLTRKERMDLEDAAIRKILEREPELDRTPANNPGFDLTEPGPDGRPIRWIEVKAMKGTLEDRPVGLTRTQFRFSQEQGEAFWLYVVQRAGSPEQANVVRIQDPAGRAKTFTLDRGWRHVGVEGPIRTET